MPTNPPRPGPPKPRDIARARRRRRYRRQRNAALVLLLVAVGLAGFALVRQRHGSGTGRRPAVTTEGALAELPVAVASQGPGTFAYATGTGAVAGSGGAVRRYRVAVENGTGQSADDFAAAVEEVLADPRGWTAGGTARFQRVAQGDAADFTVYLASPGTTTTMCAKGGLHTGGYTSCRLPGQIVVNLARWLGAVPGYGAPLRGYQQFAINHEIGRELGYGNEACPGPGQPAPVMQQQTLGLAGCVANSWPYLGGRLYRGNPIP